MNHTTARAVYVAATIVLVVASPLVLASGPDSPLLPVDGATVVATTPSVPAPVNAAVSAQPVASSFTWYYPSTWFGSRTPVAETSVAETSVLPPPPPPLTGTTAHVKQRERVPKLDIKGLPHYHRYGVGADTGAPQVVHIPPPPPHVVIHPNDHIPTVDATSVDTTSSTAITAPRRRINFSPSHLAALEYLNGLAPVHKIISKDPAPRVQKYTVEQLEAIEKTKLTSLQRNQLILARSMNNMASRPMPELFTEQMEEKSNTPQATESFSRKDKKVKEKTVKEKMVKRKKVESDKPKDLSHKKKFYDWLAQDPKAAQNFREFLESNKQGRITGAPAKGQ